MGLEVFLLTGGGLENSKRHHQVVKKNWPRLKSGPQPKLTAYEKIEKFNSLLHLRKSLAKGFLKIVKSFFQTNKNICFYCVLLL